MTIASSRLAGLAVALVLGLGSAPPPAIAQTPERPMLAEGRTTVFQRVLTRPGATLHAEPGAPASRMSPAFQPLYVFDVSPGWLRVGPSASAPSEGWVAAGDVVPWRQSIVAAFTNSAGRSRQLMFATEERLRWLLEHEALQAMQAQLLAEADAGDIAPEREVVAAEPAEFVDIRERLYLMPILDFTEDLHPLTYEPNLLMQVASVPLRDEAQPAAQSGGFDAGVVFVFDTTQSMDPYITRTQQAMERIVRELEGSAVGARINFGVMAFRDNTGAAPGLEYRTRMLLPLERRGDQTPVLATIRAASAVAVVSSPGFNEDSLAGVEDAIDQTLWDPPGDPFDARAVILITDAGPKDPRDPNARSDIGAAELAREAQDRGIAVMTLHLQTPQGGPAQHGYAAAQYQALSRFGGNTYYYGIPDGSPQAFEDTVSRLVTSLTDVIRVAQGQAPVLSPDEAGQEMLDLGLAMRLRWLGGVEGTQAPDVIAGWVSERAVEDPSRLAIEPRLLVTKNELATMAELIDQLLILGEQNRDAEDAATFFAQVRDVVANMAQNPDRLLDASADTLGGALEFLEDLPYRSQILTMTEDRWAQSAMNRRSVLDGMRQKLVQYRKWLFDPEVWTALHDGAPDGEHVFAMPFDVLP